VGEEVKILFISHGTNCKGGAERVLRDLILALPSYIQPFCVFNKSHGTFIDTLKEKGIPVYTFPFYGSVCIKPENSNSLTDSYLNAHKTVASLVKLINEEKIDLVVTNTATVLDGAFAARCANIPHIWYVHEILSQDPDLLPLLAYPLTHLYPLISFLSSKIFVVSQAVKHELIGYLSEDEHSKIRVIHNGIKFAEGEPPQRGTGDVVLSVGTVCKRKGYEQFIFAASQAINDFPHATFIIAGRSTPEYLKVLQARMKVYGLGEDRILFKSFTENIEGLYKRASMLVLASECEPFGLVVLEAMRAGLPVISTECGGPQEIVVDGVTGFIVKKSEIGTAIKVILKDRKLGDKLGMAGYQYARESFSHEKYMEHFLEEIAL
jgi:glycosyltransferase involved in cell wall biosynthesis